jgi:hypothetical protein
MVSWTLVEENVKVHAWVELSSATNTSPFGVWI